MREKIIEFDFGWIDLQGRSSKGTTLTAHKVARVVNAPKSADEDKKPPPARKPAPKKPVVPAREKAPPKKAKSTAPKRETSPPKVTSSESAPKKRRGRPAKPEPKGQSTLDL